jgi:hypothetical protein
MPVPESPPAKSTAQRINRILPAVTVITAAVVLGIRFFTFISDYAVNVLFYDQWDFLSLFFKGTPGLGELFLYQHGPHREGLGLVVDRFLYPATDWNTRAESFLIGGCVFAAALVALLLKYRLFGRLSYGDVAIPLIFLTTAQYETFIGTPNAAYSGIPLLLILCYCLALTSPRYQVRYALCLVLNFFLIFTGFGVFMGPVTVGLFALECYRRVRGLSQIPLGATLIALLLAVASMGAFFLNYRFQPAVACFVFPDPHLLAYPRFLAAMSARYFGVATSLRLSAIVGIPLVLCAAGVFSALVWRLIRKRNPGKSDLIATILLAYSILFAVDTAIGRVCLGPAAALAPRYATLLIPGVTAIYFYLQTIPLAGIRRAITTTFILLLIPGCLSVDSGADWYADGKRAWVDCYLRTENVSECDKSAGFVIHPYPDQTGLKEKLDYLKARQLNLFSPQ